MFIGSALFDVLLPAGTSSLKEKRSVVKPVLAGLRRLDVAVAEVGGLSLYRRAEIGVATVSPDAAHVRDVLEACERLVEGRTELELLSVRRQLRSSTDEEHAGHG